MKFGSWTYNLDAIQFTANKSWQINPTVITGHGDDGFSEELFENNGVSPSIDIHNHFIVLLNIEATCFSGMGNTWRSRQTH